MAKRYATSQPDEESGSHKKQRRFENNHAQQVPAEDITKARQLQGLLVFEQGSPDNLRYGVRRFKGLLDTILYDENEHIRNNKLSVLEDYLVAQKGHSTNRSDQFLSDIFQTWSFASTTNNDALVAAVPAVLALLLRVIANTTRLKDHGASLCQQILHSAQLKLVARSLSERYKDYVCSPALRLLTEVVSFDDGVFARRLYSNRTFTFNPADLSGLLHSRSIDRSKPSVRSNAVRFVLANFRYQNEGAKMDIMGQKKLSTALFAHLQDDTHATVRDILTTVRNHVVLDMEIDRPKKTYFLDAHNLKHVLSVLRRRDEEDEVAESVDDGVSKPIQDLAQEFLSFISTTPKLGVFLPGTGWYPSYVDLVDVEDDRPAEGAALPFEDEDWREDYEGGVPVKNKTLSDLVHSFRPHANETEKQLLLDIFMAAPELVAKYFLEKSNFPFDPALSTTWIGYAAFLFSVVDLPAPPFAGRPKGFATGPPPVQVVIESILPKPLTQKVLTKCLNQSSDLVSFFVVRLVTISLQKLAKVLEMYKQASPSSAMPWSRGRERLVKEFQTRCPQMKDVVNLFRRIPETKMMQKEAVTRLMALYYQVVPQLALEQPFDVAVPLTTVLQSLEELKLRNGVGEDEEDGELQAVKLLYLDHLLVVARYSLNMQWWKKPEALTFSPFVTLLRLAARSRPPSAQVTDLLNAVIDQHSIMQKETVISALRILLGSLRELAGLVHGSVFSFLDLCLSFYVKKALKYEDDIEGLQHERQSLAKANISIKPISTILATFVEQLPFVEKTSIANSTPEHLTAVVSWLARLLNFLRQAGEDDDLLTIVRYRMCRALTTTECISLLDDAFERSEKLEECVADTGVERDAESDNKSVPEPTSKDYTSFFEELRPQREDPDHPGLTRWSLKPVEEAIEQGHVASLFECLASEDQSIRTQALIGVRKFVLKVDQSDHPDKAGIVLLAKSLLETLSSRLPAHPAPYILTTFGARALSVLCDPEHDLYPKINTFLLMRPSWRVANLPAHFDAAILRGEPETDTSYWEEVQWYVDWLFDGLRTAADLEVLRRCGTFEMLMALYDGVYTPRDVRDGVVRVLGRATWVEGGSGTMVTRAGVLGWLAVAVEREWEGKGKGVMGALTRRVWETCDRERVDEWSKGQVEGWVEGMLGKA